MILEIFPNSSNSVILWLSKILWSVHFNLLLIRLCYLRQNSQIFMEISVSVVYIHVINIELRIWLCLDESGKENTFYKYFFNSGIFLFSNHIFWWMPRFEWISHGATSEVAMLLKCTQVRFPWASQLLHLEAGRWHLLYHPPWMCTTAGHNWEPTPPVSEEECMKVPDANRHCQILKVVV